MTSEQLSVTTTIPVTPAEVFAVLADPTSHAAINGSVGGTSSVRTGWVNGAIDTEPITEAGQVFRMGMFHPDHPDGDYVTANQVREFEPPRAISWATGTEDDDGRLSFGGWFWRYDLSRDRRPGDGGPTDLRLVRGGPGVTRGHRLPAVRRRPPPGQPGPARGLRHVSRTAARRASPGLIDGVSAAP